MPLPHYHSSMEPIYPVSKSLFNIILITPNFYIEDLTSNVSFINTKSENIIDISFNLNTNNFKKFNLDNYLKDIGYIVHSVESIDGDVLKKFLIDVKFISSEVKFSHNDSDILFIKLKVLNLKSSELDNSDSTLYHFDNFIKSLQRELKIENIL